jgi:hypothetical protein
VLVVAMEVAGKVAGVGEAPTAAGGAARAPVVDDGGLFWAAEVDL